MPSVLSVSRLTSVPSARLKLSMLRRLMVMNLGTAEAMPPAIPFSLGMAR